MMKILLCVAVVAMAITAILNRKTIYAELNRSPKFSDLVQFGLIFLGGMGLIGAAYRFYFNEPEVAQKLWIIAGSVMVLSLIPPIGRLLYIVWMGFGLTMGFFTAPIIMGLVYVIVIVPVGLVFKIRHRD